MKDLDFLKAKPVIKEVKIKIEILPYAAPYSEYGWIRRKFMDLACKASKFDTFHKIRNNGECYYIEKITVME